MGAMADPHHHGHPPAPAGKFTDTELEAAVNLVLLSESSSGGGEMEGDNCVQHLHQGGSNNNSCSSSTSMPSVNTRPVGAPVVAAGEEEAIDEELTGPWARLQRYRSLSGLYMVTRRVEEGKARKKGPPAVATAAAERRKRKGR